MADQTPALPLPTSPPNSPPGAGSIPAPPTNKTMKQIKKMKAQHEHETAYKIATDYLEFAENCAKKGLVAGKLSGAEKKHVHNWLYELSEGGAHKEEHPYHSQWKAIQTKAGKSRVAAQLTAVAKSLLISYKFRKYPNFYAQIFSKPTQA